MFRFTLFLITLLMIAGNISWASYTTNPIIDAVPQSLSRAQTKLRKRALLVGVSKYCRDKTEAECSRTGKYWWDLNSGNDVDRLEEILTSERFGFRSEDVKVLKTNDDTTRDNILKTFKSFLIDQTVPGDIVYFHFSGHGSQVEDDEQNGENPKVGDELDGLDESLVPSDYKTRGDGRNNIRDDELERLLAQLSGRQVTVTVDSCYSGTITRGGVRLVRGMKLRRSIATNGRGMEDGPSGIFQEGAALPASLVVISAAQNNQLASETVDKATKKPFGALSSALITALPTVGPETTYRDLFERLSDEVTREIRDQHPQLEGSRDNILFSGTVLPPKPYINLHVEQNKVMLRAGSLQAMTKGSRFSLYALGTDSKNGSPLAQGEIVNVGPTMSVLNVTPVPDNQMLEKLRTARAFETFHNFGDARIKVSIEAGAKAVLGDKGLRELQELDLVTLVEETGNDWTVRICRRECQDERLMAGQEVAGPGVVTLMRDDGSIVSRLAEGPKLLDSIRTALEGEARWRFIKLLRNETDPALQVKLRLVPVTDVQQDPITRLASGVRVIAEEVQPSAGNQIVLHEGDTVMLEAMNLGPDELYISILDLRSNGEIGPLFPHPLVRSGINENRLDVRNDKDGKPLWQRIPLPFVLRIGKPYGNEVFKAIVTTEPADFSPLFRQIDAEDIQQRRPRGTVRGNDEARSPLGQVLLTLTTGKIGKNRGGGTRGPSNGRTGMFGAEDAARMSLPLDGWSTAEIAFEARPPKETSLGTQNIQSLELNKPVERELAGAQSHSYPIGLSAGQYLRAVADQRGIDVVLTLLGPNNKQIVEVDSPNGTQGPESLSAIAEVSGDYRLEVRSLEKDAPAGRYQIKIEELRVATARDKNSVAAQRVFLEGEHLRAQRTADSLPQAIKKYEEALLFSRAAEDREQESITLHRIGFTYDLLGNKQKALDYFTQVIPLARMAGDREGEAAALNSVGMVHHSLGNRQKALDCYQQALVLTREIENREGEAATLNNIGMAHDALGDYQKALDYYLQALPVVRAIQERTGEAKTLTNIGVVHQLLGDRQKALDYFTQALSIHRAVGDRVGEATVLTNIGAAYDELGEPRKTLNYYLQALSLYREAGDQVGESTALNNLGIVYAGLGETQRALSYYEEALPIYHATGDRNGEATLLVNFGGIYRSLGERRKTLDYLTQALSIFRAVGDRRGEATTLNNIGSIYNSLGETEKALEYHSQALPITRLIDFLDGEAQTLSNLGAAYYSLGNKQKALDYYEQALALEREIGDRGGEASTLNNIGAIYDSLDESRKALDYYGQALPLRRAKGDRRGEATTLSNLVATHRSLDNRRLAIFYGKQAADLHQQLRADINRLDKELQKTYLKSVEGTYRALTELLIVEDRLAEAHQVLNAFKDQQYFDLDQAQGNTILSLVRTSTETEFIGNYEKSVGIINRIQGDIADLKRKLRNRKPSEEEARQLKQLEANYKSASTEFSELLKQAETEFEKPAADQRVGHVPDTMQMQTALRQLKKDTGYPVVAVYTLIGAAKFYALIITPDDITSVSSAISGKELNYKAQQLWALLQSDAHDPTILSHDLYTLIFKPIKEKLPVDTRTILWSLDGNLRYLPMAALYDGKQYLVERYNHVSFTRVDSERMTRAPNRRWTGVGLASSQEHTVEVPGSRIRFDALPGVDEELRAVFRTSARTGGALDGEVLPDKKFTKTAMLAALARRRPVVHIASHFSFRSGDETRSFLLLGDGSVLTLAEMKSQRDLFAGVELLTLSACNTAAQHADADGREIDAFAELAQRLGANAVMATLWPLADDSAPLLMGEFYRKRQAGGGMVKAEALREAQLALLRGGQRISLSKRTRRAGPEPPRVEIVPNAGARIEGRTRADVIFVEASNTSPYKRDEKKPFAHPYYWAPVILIGNLR